jgi:hypothetical protein
LQFAAITSSPPTKLANSQRTANGACARGWPPPHYNWRSLCASTNASTRGERTFANGGYAAIANFSLQPYAAQGSISVTHSSLSNSGAKRSMIFCGTGHSCWSVISANCTPPP